MNKEQICEMAIKAMDNAYVPYSGYRVGAALLCEDGTVYTGCNIENAAYSPSNCAERTAIFKAVSEGTKEFVKIAIVGGKVGEEITEFAYPCGVCRQVMAEFCDVKKMTVLIAKSENEFVEKTLDELLPMSFGGSIWSI